MAEYIKREDIIKWIDDSLELCGDRYSVEQENIMELFRTVVNECLPFADVVEVVRCKDCKHWFDNGTDYGSCDQDALVRHKCFFCFLGERRET